MEKRWKASGRERIHLDKRAFPLVRPRVPAQKNGCDCGVFVLRYAKVRRCFGVPTLEALAQQSCDMCWLLVSILVAASWFPGLSANGGVFFSLEIE